MKKLSENPYFQPALMMIASGLNIVGSSIALANGEAQKNPFFGFSFATSIIYAIANGIKVGQIYDENKRSFVEKLEAERAAKTVLTSVSIEK